MKLKVLIKEKEIKKRVKEIAEEIKKDYKDKNPLLIGILKGGVVFLADLIRNLNFPHEVEFLRVSSYGSKSISDGKIKWIMKPQTKIKGRHVIIVEDIIDTGYTLKRIYEEIKKEKPISCKICVFLDKFERRKVDIHLDYVGFRVPNFFLVGYGLDFDEKFRYLKDIRIIDLEEENE
jgi:hypoxanthine phosphoribosyltransferase